jgi:MFS transporter, UMF1 family
MPNADHAQHRLAGSWILYDIASSGYALLITAVAFPLYFKFHVMDNAPWSEAVWGALLAISNIVAGLLAPLVGVVADRANARLRLLAYITACCSVCTVALAWPNAGAAWIGLLFVASLVAYLVAASLYDALLKSVVPEGTAAQVATLSALGWGLGYLGGLTCYGLSQSLATTSVASADAPAFALTFPIVGLFYGVLAAISILGMRKAGGNGRLPAALHVWQESLRQSLATLRTWKTGGTLPRLITGAHLATGAVATIALFTPIMFAGRFGLSVKEVALLSAIFSLLSIPATIAAGLLARRIAPLALLFALFPVWIALLVILLSGSGWSSGLAAAICLGVALGPTNALARAVVATAISVGHAGEMFGFAAMVNRLTTAIGPLLFGLLSSATGQYWPALLASGAALLSGYALVPRDFRIFRRWTVP